MCWIKTSGYNNINQVWSQLYKKIPKGQTCVGNKVYKTDLFLKSGTEIKCQFSLINYIIIMRNRIFTFPQIYPAVLSLVSWAVSPFVWYHTWGLCSAPGPPPSRWGLRPHNVMPSSFSVTTPPSWDLAPGIHFLFSLKAQTLYVSNWLTASLSVGLVFQEDAQTTGHGEGRKQRVRGT